MAKGIVATLLAMLALSAQEKVKAEKYNVGKVFPASTKEYEVNLKSLILSKGDPTITGDRSLLPKAYFEGLGIPYDYFNQIPTEMTNACPYNVVVLAHEDIDYKLEEISSLEEYSRRCKARIVFLHLSAHFDNFELIPQSQSYVDDTRNTKIIFKETVEAKIIADIMNTDSKWDAFNLSPYSYYPAEGTASETKFVPIMSYESKNVPLDDKALAAVTMERNGAEIMFFFFNAARNDFNSKLNLAFDAKLIEDDFTSFNLANANMWYMWASRGIFMGQRRIPVQPHIDDWFLQSDIYNSTTPYRITGADVEDTITWLDGLNDKFGLHKDSNITLDIVYNGAGLAQQGYKDKTLGKATKKYSNRFNFISHTWTHQNADWLDAWACANKTNFCQPDYTRLAMELDYNIRVANGEPIVPGGPWLGYIATPGNQIFENDFVRKARFSPHSLVCPEISGLRPASEPGKEWTPEKGGRKPNPRNEIFFKALTDFNITAVVADNTKPYMLNQKNVHHGVKSTIKEYGYEGVLIIPRWAINIDYNLHTFEAFEHYWNQEQLCWWMQHDAGCGNRLSNYTAEEAIALESLSYSPYSLSFRQDSFMFHQANVKSNERNGEKISLVGMWIEEWLKHVTKHVKGLPFMSPRMDDVAQAYRDREDRDNCKPVGKMVIDKSGSVKEIMFEKSNKTEQCFALLTVIGDTNPIKKSFEDSAEYMTKHGSDFTLKIPLFSSDLKNFTFAVNEASPAVAIEKMGVDENGDFFPLDTLVDGLFEGRSLSDDTIQYNGIVAHPLNDGSNSASELTISSTQMIISGFIIMLMNLIN